MLRWAEKFRFEGLALAASHPHLARRETLMAYTFSGSFDRDYGFASTPSRRERIARIDALASLLDTAFILPGTNVRFGLDAIIGLVPGIGDAITTAMSLYIVHEARQIGAPRHVILRMLANVMLDGIVGAVPVVGDAFDVLWRANRRNMRLLQNWLDREGRYGAVFTNGSGKAGN
jgi:hypothetical protein